MRGARLGHPAHRDGGRTHRVPPHPAQATTRIASSTSNTSTTTIQVTLTSSVTITDADQHQAPVPADVPPGSAALRRAARRHPVGHRCRARHARRLAGAVRGQPAGHRPRPGPHPPRHGPGPARPRIPDPLHVGAGDTLSGIAAALGTPGGWPALYAANRRVIGPDPDAIRAGTVLAIPHAASPASHPARCIACRRRRHRHQHRGTVDRHAPAGICTGVTATDRTGISTGIGPAVEGDCGQRHPRSAQATSTGGLPRWLEIVLAAAGLLIATAFLTEPVLAIARRRRAARPAAADAHIVLADYERLVVTHSRAGRHRLRAAPARRRPAGDPAGRPPRPGPGPLRGPRWPPRSPRPLAQRVTGAQSADGTSTGRPDSAGTGSEEPPPSGWRPDRISVGWEPSAAMIFLTAVGLPGMTMTTRVQSVSIPVADQDRALKFSRGARLRAAHRHRGVARGQAGGSSATRVERGPGAAAPGQRDPVAVRLGTTNTETAHARLAGGRDAAQRRDRAPRRRAADVLFRRPGRQRARISRGRTRRGVIRACRQAASSDAASARRRLW